MIWLCNTCSGRWLVLTGALRRMREGYGRRELPGGAAPAGSDGAADYDPDED